MLKMQKAVTSWNYSGSVAPDLCRVGTLIAQLGQWNWAETIALSLTQEEQKYVLVQHIAQKIHAPAPHDASPVGGAVFPFHTCSAS
ncbi:hypothetical protein KSC_072100 [Ktedonobacter sp. SOSP1-52]|nr:hypothetical protein KSC_072100 [Ktedonobacter sp. SOSP1-52]